MQNLVVVVVVALLVFCWSVGCDETRKGTVYYTSNGYEFHDDVLDCDNGVACAVLQEREDTTGLNIMYVNTSSAFNDAVQMHAAGYLEGALTVSEIHSYHLNYMNSSFSPKYPPSSGLKNFMEQQLSWVKRHCNSYRGIDTTYWNHVCLVVEQIEGMYEGYSKVASTSSMALEFMDLYLLMMAGDMEDLGEIFSEQNVTNVLQHVILERGSCSLFLRLLPNNEDIYAGHNLWNDFRQMNRIFKHYSFDLQSDGVAAKSFSFSSKPADLISKDDFWVLSSGLVVMETSLIVTNFSLYKEKVLPETVPAFIRAIVANRMSKDVNQWVNTYSKYNSGTHNAQFVITDMKLFKPGIPRIAPGTVMLVEDIPGYIEYKDVSALFEEQGYWAGYNVPYFPKVNQLCGNEAFAEKYGHWFVYDEAPRARIFRRDRGLVDSWEKMKWMMQHNGMSSVYTREGKKLTNHSAEWESDDLSEGYPLNAVSSRGDLIRTPNEMGLYPTVHGGVDSKITSWERSQKMQSEIISGPTHQEQAPFSWDPIWKDMSHEGLPNLWNFGWVENPPYPEEL